MADASVAARKVNTQLPRAAPGTIPECGHCRRVFTLTRTGLVRTQGPVASRCPGSRSLPLAGGDAPSANGINRTNETDLPKNIAANANGGHPASTPQKLCETDQEDPASLARTRREEAHFHD